jgi:adenylosuccinate synthase
VDRVQEEIAKYDTVQRTLISQFAPVVDEHCREYEREHLKYIASTFQGTGAAIGLKAMRSKDIRLVRDIPALQYHRCHFSDHLIKEIDEGKTGLVEICQGYGLTVDSEHYPYTTSRCVNVGQSLAYLDVPPRMVGNVIGVARSYIIRVGNVEGGTSGDTFVDSTEISWEELSQRLGRPVKELTTVTKRVRRVFTFSRKLFERAVLRNGVDILFLTFVDYLHPKEQADMRDYLLSSKFNFKQIYFVHGFGNFGKNIELIK